MKKFAARAIVFFSFIVSGNCLATAGEYGAAGCGLGSVIFGKQSGFVQVFAATTNASTYTNLFGITSGTSNCEKNAVFSSNNRLNRFVQANLDNLAKEISVGHGESLDALSELMEVPAERKPAFYHMLQSKFADIFPSEHVVTASVIENIFALSSVN